MQPTAPQALSTLSGFETYAIPRSEALARLRLRLGGRRREIRQSFESGALDGMQAARALSDMIDELLVGLAAYAGLPDDPQQMTFSLCATGGYGVGLLAPFSDVDLLFLTEDTPSEALLEKIEYVLYTLWDLGLQVGHATRSIAQCLEAASDATICTTLLDLRPIYGSRALAGELSQALHRELQGERLEKFVEARLVERGRRHHKYGDTPYLVEPNIKEGGGGLRDLQALNWIGNALLGRDSGTSPGPDQPNRLQGLAASCLQLGHLTARETYRAHKIWRFFWTVRLHLHYTAGRAEERLTFDMQPIIGARMGYANHGRQRGVERFMRHYYLMARSVMQLTSVLQPTMLLQLQNHLHATTPRYLPGPEGFHLLNGRLTAMTSELFSNTPLNLFRLLAVASKYQLPLHPNAVQHLIRQERHIAELRGNPEAAELFLDLLCAPARIPPAQLPSASADNKTGESPHADVAAPDRKGAEPLAARPLVGTLHRHEENFWLPLLNETGLLARFLPDWSRVMGQTQIDGYHIYTVDEHIIEGVRVLRQLEIGRMADEIPVAYTLARNLQGRRALYVAALIHDIGKGRGRDHSQLGSELAVTICAQLHLTPEETDTVSWLILHHLLLSHTAFSRDIDDPQTILDLADIIQSPERLRLLLLLTIADVRAVGPRGWNTWKATLLHRLYTRLADVLEGGQQTREDDQRVAEARAQVARALRPATSETEIGQFLKLGGPGYWLGFDAHTHVRHAHLTLAQLQHPNESGIRVDLHPLPSRGITELTVLCPDRPGVFSLIAKALAICGTSISDARIYTLSNGMALDTFWIQDQHGEAFEERAHLERLEAKIIQLLSAQNPEGGQAGPYPPLSDEDALEIAPDQTAALRRLGNVQVPSRVLIDNEASDKFTVVEVNGRDRPHLLFELTATLKREGVHISSAHVTTYGLRAVDVFYLHDAHGRKITAPAQIARLRESLLRVLTGPAA
ncbi:[protein-PII] uridylyltransferase [Oecophyllibacter saccharovorans]|uniref:[protein-PII] uridylyltransferase n=1 Tax=Oecophyllibacter saccharovorans TaxID=2558360 RepID=UPI001143DF43|nr:[protein-PII] uridylyltransferase [Oecophyllibacter saccharovorans]QDH15701.1 [protein-PII] uridylyltransferase [Oecophyllibacter saccharovorans]